MKNKIILFVVLLPFLIACSQEQLIYTRNISLSELISLEQVMYESGLSGVETEDEEVKIVDETASQTYYVEPTIPSVSTTNIYRTVVANEPFSISINEPNSFIVLSSIPDEVTYYVSLSTPDDGFFYFESGDADSVIQFEIYNLGGDIQKKMKYHLTVMDLGISSDDSNEVDLSSLVNDDEDLVFPDTRSIDVATVVIASLTGLSDSEKIRVLEKNIDDTVNSTSTDRELMRYELLDILIGQRSFTDAEQVINELTVDESRNLYWGRFYWKKYQYSDALIYYRSSFDGDEETEKSAILEIEEMLLEYGNVDNDSVDYLMTSTDDFSEDSDFYAESMINIARLYEFLWEVYESEKIYLLIIDGEYSREMRRLAEAYYEELQDNFLYYK